MPQRVRDQGADAEARARAWIVGGTRPKADRQRDVATWQAARRFAAALAEQISVVEPESTPSQPTRGCPDWCAQGHRCTVGRLSQGEHRSDPLAWDTGYGRLLITLTQRAGGRVRIEVRTVIGLDDPPEIARVQARRLAVGLDLTVRAVLDQIGRQARAVLDQIGRQARASGTPNQGPGPLPADPSEREDP